VASLPRPTSWTPLDLIDGGTKRVLVGKVLSSTLLENFPDDSYAGKSSRAVQGPAAGKRHKSMTVQEVIIEGPAEEKKAQEVTLSRHGTRPILHRIGLFAGGHEMEIDLITGRG